MTPPETDQLARDWYADRYQSVVVSRNRCLVTAIAALTLAALQAGALILLLPLKTSVPFVIKEEVSGAITTVIPLSGDRGITQEESARKYFLARYVIARETYDPADLAENYRAVVLMSDAGQVREFTQRMSSNNPQSPVRLYGTQARRLIRIKSISFLNDHLAQVRFTAAEKKTSDQESAQDWIALVGFQFGLAPSLESDRLVNPLGFVVISYRIDQEVLP